MLDDASRVLAVACMLIASRNSGEIPDDPEYVRRVAYLNRKPDFSPLIKTGFLTVQADASECKRMLANDTQEEEESRDRLEEECAGAHDTSDGKTIANAKAGKYSAPPKPRSFKQWTPEEFRQVIADANQDRLLTDAQCDEFFGYWTEPSASGIPRFRQQQNWDTRRRMQNAKRMIFDNAKPRPGGAGVVSDDVRFAEAQRQPGYLQWNPEEKQKYVDFFNRSGAKKND